MVPRGNTSAWLLLLLFNFTAFVQSQTGFILARADLEYREIQFEWYDRDTGQYLACGVDSVTQAGSSIFIVDVNLGPIAAKPKDDNVLYPPGYQYPSTIVHLSPIKGTPYSDCSFGGISRLSNGTEYMFAVLGQSSNSETVLFTPIPELPNQDNMFGSVLWSDLGLITIAWGGGSNLTSYLNNDLSQKGPFSYLAPDSSKKATIKHVRYINNNRFWVMLGITSGYTLLYKCNSTFCAVEARINGTTDFWMDARETDEWWGCGKQTNGYFCTSYQDPAARVYMPQEFVTDNPTITSFHSTCLMKDSMILFLSPTRLNYTLIALNVQNNFDILTVSTHKDDTDIFTIACLEEAIIVPTWSGYDFWSYFQPDSLIPPAPPVAPVAPVAPPVAEPVAVPIDVPVASEPVTPPQAQIDPPVITPSIDVPLTAGLTASLVGAALGVSLFLLIFFLKKKQNKDDGSKPSANGDVEMNVQNPSVYVPTPSNLDSSGVYVAAPGDRPIDSSTYSMIPIKADEIDSKMLIPYKEIVIEKEIGSGSFGKVYIGQWRGANVAIKSNTRSADAEAFLTEARLTAALPPHPNVVLTYGISIDGNVPYIVLEYCDSGSLDSALFKKTLSAKDQRSLVKGLAYGLYHLHRHHIVHRDLAARNILMHQGVPKISDFGMSRVLKEAAQGQTNSNVGPIRWMAPESIKKMEYSTKSDVWSFGILVSEIVNGQEPHLDTNQIEIAIRIRDEGLTPSIENCDPALEEVMRLCWKVDPNERPSMAELCEFINQKM